MELDLPAEDVKDPFFSTVSFHFMPNTIRVGNVDPDLVYTEKDGYEVKKTRRISSLPSFISLFDISYVNHSERYRDWDINLFHSYWSISSFTDVPSDMESAQIHLRGGLAWHPRP